MRRRIFIAINLPEKIKNRLKGYREKHDNLPVRWTKTSSWHLTLVFIGYVDNEQMLEACRIARKVASGTGAFFVDFNRIVLGPAGAKEPRMIWLKGEVNEELVRLKSRLEYALLVGNTGLQKVETRVFNPHLTLARIKADQWCKLSTYDVDNIQQDFEARVGVNSIEVMESDLKFDGAEYATLEECPLGE